MRGFLITLIIVILVAGGGAWWLWQNSEKLPEGSLPRQVGQKLHTEPAEVPARTPSDYHVLEANGSIPLAEAERAGLNGADYAYLRGIQPIMMSEGIGAADGFTVRGKHYDLCYVFATTPPGEQYLEYNIAGQWDELHFGFGFDDSHPSDPEGEWAIDLEIKADGEIVYGPETVEPTTDPIFTSIDVTGVNRLTFTSRRVGKRNTFAPVLVTPFLKKAPLAASE